MSRRKLKYVGALLALCSLLVLNLHVLAHVFGVDHDDDDARGKNKAAPCALCQAVLAQTTLAAAPSIVVPDCPLAFASPKTVEPLARGRFFCIVSCTRGPPALCPA